MSEKRVGGLWLSYGFHKGISLGISIDTYHFNIDFFCFYVGIEF